jgi:ubiquitin carboxyl-terminal hydrolase 20/33
MKEPSSDTDSYETCDTSNSSSESSITGNSSDSGVDCLNTHKSNELNETVPLLNKSHETNRSQKEQKLKQYSSIISDLFHGKLISQVQCLKCESISKTIETIQDLSLPIPNREYIQSLQNRVMKRQSLSNDSCVVSVTYQSWFTWVMSYIKSFTAWSSTQIQLQDCLNAYFSEADLKGDNMYNCEKCKELNDGVKYSKLLDLPETLVIHLKRFRHEFLFSNKINTYVSFPLNDLDLRDYLHDDYKHNDESYLYDLYGVICHHGNSSAGGHYTCYALNATNYEWYEYDDSHCTQVDATQVTSCQAYVLFYRKKNDKMYFIRDELRRLLSRNKQDITEKPYFISKQWLNKFKHFAKPGKVSNEDVICSHNAVYPHLWSRIDNLIVPVTSFVWDYFSQKFGLSKQAQLNHLEPCKQCLIDEELIKKRMFYEKNTFSQLNNTKKNDDFNHETASFAISTIWFKKWDAFVNGKQADPPGQIQNRSICTTKNGSFILNMSKLRDYKNKN